MWCLCSQAWISRVILSRNVTKMNKETAENMGSFFGLQIRPRLRQSCAIFVRFSSCCWWNWKGTSWKLPNLLCFVVVKDLRVYSSFYSGLNLHMQHAHNIASSGIVAKHLLIHVEAAWEFSHQCVASIGGHSHKILTRGVVYAGCRRKLADELLLRSSKNGTAFVTAVLMKRCLVKKSWVI